MKTKIIEYGSEKILKEYSFLITMNRKDMICIDGVFYRIINNMLYVDENIMVIRVLR